jgi:hypothetical protein
MTFEGGLPVLSFLAADPKVQIKPDPSGLPGSDVLQGLLNGLAFWALLATLAGALIGAATMAIATHFNNHHWASRGKSGALVSAAAAFLIGAAAAIINFFAAAGGKVK